MSINCKQILYLAAAILLSLPVVSCSSTKSNTHTYRPYHERRNRGGSAHDDNPTATTTDKKRPIAQEAHGLVNDEWARLDIKLGRHDNKKLYKELKRWLGTPYAYAEHTCGEGTDCSGMVMEVFLTVYGIKVHRNSAKMLAPMETSVSHMSASISRTTSLSMPLRHEGLLSMTFARTTTPRISTLRPV